MTAPPPTAVTRRGLHALLATAALLLLVAGCDQQSGDSSRQIESLRADTDEAKRRVSVLQNSLAAKDARLADTVKAVEAMKIALADKNLLLAMQEKQLRTAQTDLATLQKHEALVFAEAAAAQQKAQPTIARAAYEKFLVDHPNSALVPAANAALAQLTQTTGSTSTLDPQIVAIVDPKRQERAFQKTFAEGYMTLQELGPILKKKSLKQVLALLGRPNQTFNSGTELGYANRAINPATGTRGMLVIGFDAGTVANMRVEYAGRKYVP